jgi:hypothetical protein
MTALDKDKAFKSKWTGRTIDAMPVATAALLYMGALVAINSGGYAAAAGDTVGHRVVGVAPAQADNSDGNNGDIKSQAVTGVFFFKNSGGNPVVAAGRGRVCYVEDDQTVAATSANSIVAGIVESITSAGVWVYVGPEVAESVIYPTWQETKTSGALTKGAATSNLSIDGTQAFTLANGDYVGQRKKVVVTVAANTPIGTLTVATGYGSVANKVYKFHAVGQEAELEWYSTGWRLMSKKRAGALTVVVGTTVLTGYVFAAVYNLSIDGTVTSTLTKALPDPDFQGELVELRCTAAANTPVGNIDGNFKSLAAAATTHAAVDATTDYAILQGLQAGSWLVPGQQHDHLHLIEASPELAGGDAGGLERGHRSHRHAEHATGASHVRTHHRPAGADRERPHRPPRLLPRGARRRAGRRHRAGRLRDALDDGDRGVRLDRGHPRPRGVDRRSGRGHRDGRLVPDPQQGLRVRAADPQERDPRQQARPGRPEAGGARRRGPLPLRRPARPGSAQRLRRRGVRRRRRRGLLRRRLLLQRDALRRGRAEPEQPAVRRAHRDHVRGGDAPVPEAAQPHRQAPDPRAADPHARRARQRGEGGAHPQARPRARHRRWPRVGLEHQQEQGAAAHLALDPRLHRRRRFGHVGELVPARPVEAAEAPHPPEARADHVDRAHRLVERGDVPEGEAALRLPVARQRRLRRGQCAAGYKA